MWGCPVHPLGSQFYADWCSTVGHAQPCGGGLQRWVWGHFGALWWFQGLSETWPTTSSQYAPSEVIKTFRLTWECPGFSPGWEFYTWACCVREDIARTALFHLSGSAPFQPPPLSGSEFSFLLSIGWFVWSSSGVHALSPELLPWHSQQSPHHFCQSPITQAINHLHFSVSQGSWELLRQKILCWEQEAKAVSLRFPWDCETLLLLVQGRARKFITPKSSLASLLS